MEKADPVMPFVAQLRTLQRMYQTESERADRAEFIRDSARAQGEHYLQQRERIVRAGCGEA